MPQQSMQFASSRLPIERVTTRTKGSCALPVHDGTVIQPGWSIWGGGSKVMGATEKQWAWLRTRAEAIIGRTWSAEYESIVEEIGQLPDEAETRSAGPAPDLGNLR